MAVLPESVDPKIVVTRSSWSFSWRCFWKFFRRSWVNIGSGLRPLVDIDRDERPEDNYRDNEEDCLGFEDCKHVEHGGMVRRRLPIGTTPNSRHAAEMLGRDIRNRAETSFLFDPAFIISAAILRMPMGVLARPRSRRW